MSSWSATFSDLAAYLPTPYKLTPKWAPFFVKVWSYPNNELYPNVNPAFNPVLFDEVQNAAYWMAEEYQEHLELGLQFVVIPAAISFSSNMALWALQKLASGAAIVLPVPSVSIVPARVKAAFDWFTWPIKTAAQTIYNSKIVSYFIVPEIVSHIMHQRGLKQFYKDMRPVMKAFMRPFYERIIPSLFGSLDKGDLGTSFRKWVIDDKPSWYNSVMKVVSYVPHCIGLIFKPDPVPKTWAEINRPYAYHLGQDAVAQVERGLAFVRDIFWSTTQILPSLSSWENFTQAKADLAKYFEVQLTWLNENWEPISEAAKSWTGAILAGLGNILKSIPGMTSNAIANIITEEDSDSWTRTAAQLVGYLPTAFVGMYALYAAALSVLAGFRAIRDTIYPGVVDSFRNIIQFVGMAQPAPIGPAPAGLQANLANLLGHGVAQHNADWLAMPQVERQYLNQALNNGTLHNVLAGLAVNDPAEEAVVNQLALNP